MKSYQPLAAAVLTVALFASPAMATFVDVTHENLATCDTLNVPKTVDELGFLGVFPPDEMIDAIDNVTTLIACPGTAVPGTVNQRVTITNLTNKSFNHLWYVADPETRFTNVDGLVNDQEAFKIDSVGLNRPLLSEDINTNGIFEPFETWEFIVDGYSNNFGLPSSAFMSPGQVGSSSGNDSLSSASIIALPVPEPATGLLMLLGLGAMARRRG